MKRIFSFLLLTAVVTISQAQVVDFTGVDIETETVKVVADPGKRQPGLLFGIGFGGQSLNLGDRIDYKPVALTFDCRLLDWQVNSQFEWNILSIRTSVTSDNEGEIVPLPNVGTQFAFYFSPKVRSFFVSGRVGYCSSDEYYLNRSPYAYIDGATLSASIGYAWRHGMLEAFADTYTVNIGNETCMQPSIGCKLTFFAKINFR